MQSTELVTRLYQAVDSRTAASLEPFLSPSVTFQLGNNLPVSGKEAVLQVNASFFESVAAMAHTIDKVWSQDADVICSGSVQYRTATGETTGRRWRWRASLIGRTDRRSSQPRPSTLATSSPQGSRWQR